MMGLPSVPWTQFCPSSRSAHGDRLQDHDITYRSSNKQYLHQLPDERARFSDEDLQVHILSESVTRADPAADSISAFQDRYPVA